MINPIPTIAGNIQPLSSAHQKLPPPLANRVRPIFYKPGEKVPISGIYLVQHCSSHIATHEVTCVEGEPFPPCRNCGVHPKFSLVMAALHINQHSFFANSI